MRAPREPAPWVTPPTPRARLPEVSPLRLPVVLHRAPRRGTEIRAYPAGAHGRSIRGATQQAATTNMSTATHRSTAGRHWGIERAFIGHGTFCAVHMCSAVCRLDRRLDCHGLTAFQLGVVERKAELGHQHGLFRALEPQSRAHQAATLWESRCRRRSLSFCRLQDDPSHRVLRSLNPACFQVRL